MSRRQFNNLDMRYASPDYIRPNQELLEKTKRNFSWDKFKTKHTNPPSPNLLPMPPVQWQKKTIPAATSNLVYSLYNSKPEMSDKIGNE